MSKTLKSFQEKRLEAIGTFYKAARQQQECNVDEIKFFTGGPTGSGKTFIISAAIKQFFQDAFVLVLSPGAGNLDSQTLQELHDELEPSGFDVAELQPVDFGGNPRAKQVRVVNWQSVASFEKATGKYKNVLTRFGGEDNDLFQFLSKKGAPVIIVIDEAHYGKGSSAKSIPLFLADVKKALGYTPMVFEFSATLALPVGIEAELRAVSNDTLRMSIVKVAGGTYGFTETTYDEAVGAELLRSRTLLNDGVREIVNGWSDAEAQTSSNRRLLLGAALRKQRELRGLYKKVGISVWPLVGIQLPNSVPGNEAQKDILDYLAHLPQHIDGEESIVEGRGLAIYLQDSKSDSLKDIENHGSPVRVLLYKTAVATGWNCPRAQILVGFRHLNKEQFSIQNRGRFLRTLEGKHYEEGGTSPLDWTYIYADVPTMGGLTGSDAANDHEYVRAVADEGRKTEFDACNLPSGGTRRTGQDTVDPEVIRARLEHFFPLFSRDFDEDYPILVAGDREGIGVELEHTTDNPVTLSEESVFVRAKADMLELQNQVETYLTEAFEKDGVQYPRRDYIRNARVAEHTVNHVLAILGSKERLIEAILAAQPNTEYDSLKDVIVPLLTAPVKSTTGKGGAQDKELNLHVPGARALREWVRAVFTSDDAPEPFALGLKGKRILIDPKKPEEPTPLDEGGKRDHWEGKFTGSFPAPAARLVYTENGKNAVKGKRAEAHLYRTEGGDVFPIHKEAKPTEVAFEDYLLSLVGTAGITDIWFAKSSTAATDLCFPVEWEKDGKKYISRFFPDYFGMMTFDDGTKKPFVFEVKGKTPESRDSDETPGLTKAKAEFSSRYTAQTKALCAVVYPTDAEMTEWSTFRAVTANQMSVGAFIKANEADVFVPLTRYEYSPTKHASCPSEFSWMLEAIQL